MRLKNKAAGFFALLIILLIVYIIYMGVRTTEVIIQAGHEGLTTGNTGAQTKHYREVDWNVLVADEVAKQLRSWEIEVKRVPATLSLMRANVAVSIHFDSAKKSCSSGASIGYQDIASNAASKVFAQNWKALYKQYFPFKWHRNNFTKTLQDYYGYHRIRADKFLVLELGELSCEKQTKWLKPRLKKIAHLIAYSIAKELGKEVKKPKL